jgi:hypothetical protein
MPELCKYTVLFMYITLAQKQQSAEQIKFQGSGAPVMHTDILFRNTSVQLKWCRFTATLSAVQGFRILTTRPLYGPTYKLK